MQHKKSLLWLSSIVILFAVMGISSCKKKFDEPPAYVEPPLDPKYTVMTIRDLADLHVSGANENLNDVVGADKVIIGIVNADDKSGNYFKQISLQDETGGITVRLDANNLYTTYPVGRKITIKLNGLYMGEYNGLIQLGGNAAGDGLAADLLDTYIVKGSLGNVLTPKVVTLEELNPSLQSTLIQINRAQFVVADTNKTFATIAIGGALPKSENRSVQTCSDAGASTSTIILRTSGYANFANTALPNGNGTLIGIYNVFKEDKQLVIRDASDAPLDGERCAGAESTAPFISIEALRALYTGTDKTITSNRIKGIVISDPKNITPGNIILQDGNSGIDLYFGAPAAGALAGFKVGDSLVVDISGGKLTDYNDMVEVSLSSAAVPASAAGLASAGSGKSVVPVPYTIAQIKTNMASIENTLVTILNATATGSPSTYDGNKTLTDASGNMTLRTLTAASFSASALPATCQNWVGYVSRFTTTSQIYIRSLGDVTAGTECGGGPVDPPPVGGGDEEDFETGAKTNYTDAAVALASGSWSFSDALLGTDPSDLKTGTQSARIRGTAVKEGYIQTNFDITGLKTVTFNFGGTNFNEGTDGTNEISVELKYSKDGGTTWTSLGKKTSTRGTLTSTVYDINAGAAENVRIQIINTSFLRSTGNKLRINIDDVVFTK